MKESTSNETGFSQQALSLPRALLVLALLGITFLLLQNVSGTVRTAIKRPLNKFPITLGDWRASSSHAASEAIVKMLGVDAYIEYDFINSSRQTLNFYVAFYESVGTTGGYHSPKNCIPGGGWVIEKVKTVEITPTGKQEPVRVAEMIIRNRNEYRVVLYWYQNRGRIIHSEYWEKIYQVLDAIVMKRRDGAFVRLITPVPGGDIQHAEQVLQQFTVLAINELDNFLPGK